MKMEEVPKELEKSCKEASGACPAEVIIIQE